MKKITFIIFANILLFNLYSFANKINNNTSTNQYDVNAIPAELLKNANAVVRLDEKTLKSYTASSAEMTHKYAITILNYNADRYAQFREFYDDFTKISAIKGAIYDKNGALVKKFKKKDIQDYSAVSGISLYEDNRQKIIEVAHNNYPFTVEFEFKVKYLGVVSFPKWIPILDYNVSVQQSSYKAVIPNKIGLRYKINNDASEPKVENIGGKTTYDWVMENYPAQKKEPYSPNRIFPTVYLAPNLFEYDGYQGNMQTWKSYGAWIHGLAEGRDELNSSTVAEIQALVKGINDDTEKVKKIYEYLQAKTRYISIQLGIGGWQPFEAKLVDKTGYGDCKALSNYTDAMLKAVGINSHHVVIGAGYGHTSLEEDFPYLGYMNHMILCVPLENDTIWLECTSQNNPFGYLGDFTDDRTALLITDEGGKVVRTPVYKQADNTQIRNALVKIEPDGSALVDVTTKYRGLQYENVNFQFLKNEKEQKDVLYEMLDISNMEIENFNYTQIKDRIPEATEKLNLKIKNYASVSGKRIFIPLNILNKKRRTPKKIKNRKTDVVQRTAYIDTDEITYEIPGYFKIEHLPKAVNIESDFGTYQATVTQEENKITYTRTIKIHKKTFPAERYKDLQAFYKKIVKADKMKLVVVQEDRP